MNIDENSEPKKVILEKNKYKKSSKLKHKIAKSYIDLTIKSNNRLIDQPNDNINTIKQTIINCSICGDDIQSPSCTPCFHMYHEHCLKKWIINDMITNSCSRCPECREDIKILLSSCMFTIPELLNMKEMIISKTSP